MHLGDKTCAYAILIYIIPSPWSYNMGVVLLNIHILVFSLLSAVLQLLDCGHLRAFSVLVSSFNRILFLYSVERNGFGDHFNSVVCPVAGCKS